MVRFWPLLGASALFAVLAFACKGDSGAKNETPASSPALAPTPKTYSERPPTTISADKKYSAVVETTKGKFTIELRPDIALETVNSFIFLAREGYYNGVTFHRVIPGFVAQGGDPTGTGHGGPGHYFDNEVYYDLLFDKPGVVAMANSGPDTNGSQFFITFAPEPQLDGSYTIFGHKGA